MSPTLQALLLVRLVCWWTNRKCRTPTEYTTCHREGPSGVSLVFQMSELEISHDLLLINLVEWLTKAKMSHFCLWNRNDLTARHQTHKDKTIRTPAAYTSEKQRAPPAVSRPFRQWAPGVTAGLQRCTTDLVRSVPTSAPRFLPQHWGSHCHPHLTDERQRLGKGNWLRWRSCWEDLGWRSAGLPALAVLPPK